MGVMIKNGIKYTGGGNQVFAGTTAPDPALGLNNDIYMKYSQDIIEKMYCKINNIWRELQNNGGGGTGGSSWRTVTPTEGINGYSSFSVTDVEVGS